MKTVRAVAYRHLTDADFFNINKPRETEAGGGGQAYIDFPVAATPVDYWHTFFDGVVDVHESEATQGPAWIFPIHSLGLNNDEPVQTVKIYQRRAASVTIASQKIHSNRSNRVRAWHPIAGFPRPVDDRIRNQCPEGLTVYLVATNEGEIWAGWFLNDGTSGPPCLGGSATSYLEPMLSATTAGESGIIFLPGEYLKLKEEERSEPFVVLEGNVEAPAQEVADIEPAEEGTQNPEEEADAFFEFDVTEDEDTPEIHEKVVKIRKRNRKLVRDLKGLYKHRCQVTGDEFLFKKANGVNYTEAHHLVPLGKGGADSPQNLVVLCPQIHSMLHHAEVGSIDLFELVLLEDGSAELPITINDVEHTIRYLPEHAQLFM